MPSIAEEVADRLAQEVIRAAEELGDEDLITDISRVLGTSSTTTQEAFMTAVRLRLAEGRARRTLAERIARGPVGPRKELGGGPILDEMESGGH
jgi:hypothetical protein